eukprot:2188402-Amphidinium_carterae.1
MTFPRSELGIVQWCSACLVLAICPSIRCKLNSCAHSVRYLRFSVVGQCPAGKGATGYIEFTFDVM